jgi:hypothetical protein
VFKWFKSNEEGDLPKVELVDSLWKVFKENKFDIEKINVSLRFDENQNFCPQDRHEICLCNDKKDLVLWQVSSLQDLFRGTNKPPQEEKKIYDLPYCIYLFTIEKNVLLINQFIHDVTDEEFVRVYNLMRRRPDGRSEGPIHDVIWQSAALVLGMYEISQVEYEAIFSRLAASARGWETELTSRNYIAFLRDHFGSYEE